LGMSAWLPVQAQPGDASHAGSDGLGAQLQQQRPTATPALLASLASLSESIRTLPEAPAALGTPARLPVQAKPGDASHAGSEGPRGHVGEAEPGQQRLRRREEPAFFCHQNASGGPSGLGNASLASPVQAHSPATQARPALKAQEPSPSNSSQLGQLGLASNACVAALLVL